MRVIIKNLIAKNQYQSTTHYIYNTICYFRSSYSNDTLYKNLSHKNKLQLQKLWSGGLYNYLKNEWDQEQTFSLFHKLKCSILEKTFVNRSVDTYMN